MLRFEALHVNMTWEMPCVILADKISSRIKAVSAWVFFLSSATNMFLFRVLRVVLIQLPWLYQIVHELRELSSLRSKNVDEQVFIFSSDWRRFADRNQLAHGQLWLLEIK